MCWSGEASFAVAITSFATVAYVVAKRESFLLWVPLLYAGLMELLQAYTYIYIGRCELPQNQLATYLGYLHISFQPLFMNMAALYFIPEKFRNKIACFAMPICFIFIILALIKIYPFTWAPQCQPGIDLFCGKILCSTPGSWHIAWEIPYRTFFLYNWVYFLPAFALPLLYGSWKLVFYIFFSGPPLAWLITHNPNEWPAIWCLYVIAFIFVALFTPLQRLFIIKNWYGFNYPKILEVRR
jgi:hypothetical protein